MTFIEGSKAIHATRHGAAGADPIVLTQGQVTGLTADLAAKATPADVAAAVAALVNAAPGTLDTLGELAAALASDESVAAALAVAVATKTTPAAAAAEAAVLIAAERVTERANAIATYARFHITSPGTADDKPRIIAAATAAAAAGETTLRIAPGTYTATGLLPADISGLYVVGDHVTLTGAYVYPFTTDDWTRRDQRPTLGHGRIAIVQDGGTDADTWPLLFPLTKRLSFPLGIAMSTAWDRPWIPEAWRHGWEIVAHGVDHENMATKTEAELHALAQSQVATIAAITGSTENINFVYPFHGRNTLSDRVLSQYFTTGRGFATVGGTPAGSAHPWSIAAKIIDDEFVGGVASDALKAEMHAAAATDGRLNYYFHYITPGATLEGLEDLVRYARTLGIAIVRPSELYGSLQVSPPTWEDLAGWTLTGDVATVTDKAYRGTTALKITPKGVGGGNATCTATSPQIPVAGVAGMFTVVRVSFRYWLATPLTVAAAQGFYVGVQFDTRARSTQALVATYAGSVWQFGGKVPDYPTTTIAGAGTWVRVTRLLALAPDVMDLKLVIGATHVAEAQDTNPMWIDDIRLDFVDRTAVIPFVTTLNGTTGRILRDGPVTAVSRHPITVTPLATTAGRVYVTASTTNELGARLTVYSTDAADTTQAVQVNVHAGYSWSDMIEPADGA